MLQLIAARLGSTTVTLLTTLVLVNVLLAAAPGDPLAALIGPAADHLPQGARARLSAQLGLQGPWWQRATDATAAAFRGDLGVSLRTGRAVATELTERLPTSLALASAALPLAAALGVGLGTLAAAARGSWLDRGIVGATTLIAGVPSYWMGTLLVLTFALGLGWFPSSGTGTGLHLVLPAATLALALIAPLVRMTRGAVLLELDRPFVVVARARGLSERKVLVRHALRTAAPQLVTLIGMDAGRLIGGAIFVEAVFAWPGLGRLIVEATLARDLPVVSGVVLVSLSAVALVNLLVDVAHLRLDPRVSYG